MAETQKVLLVENLPALDLGTEMGLNKKGHPPGQTVELFCGLAVFPFENTEGRQG